MTEFARWVFETAPQQVILRLDIQQFRVSGEAIDAVMVGHFQDDDGWDFGHFRIQLGQPGKPDRINYFSWRRDYYHGIWQERGFTSQWKPEWKVAKPVLCRVRTVPTVIRKDELLPDWFSLQPHSRTTLQCISQLRGIVRGLRLSYDGPIDPFVLRGTDERLSALIAQGNRELDRLVA